MAYRSNVVDRKLTEVKAAYRDVVRARDRFRRKSTGLEKTVKLLESGMENGTTRFTPEDLKGVPIRYLPLLEDLARTNRSIRGYRRGGAGNNQKILKNGETKIRQLESDPDYKRKLVRAITDEPTYQELLKWSMYGRGEKAKPTPATRYIIDKVERDRKLLKKVQDIYEADTGKKAPGKKTRPKKKAKPKKK
jgi:hypothetical protein